MMLAQKNGFYEVTTYDHKTKYIMRESATIAEWGRCLDDSRSDDSAIHPNWVKSQYSRLDRALGFMRNGFFYKPLFELDDEAKEYQAIIDYDDPNRDILRKCQFIAWGKFMNSKAVVLAGFVSSETRTVIKRAPTNKR